MAYILRACSAPYLSTEGEQCGIVQATWTLGVRYHTAPSALMEDLAQAHSKNSINVSYTFSFLLFTDKGPKTEKAK